MRNPTKDEITLEIERRKQKEQFEIESFLHHQTDEGLNKLLCECEVVKVAKGKNKVKKEKKKKKGGKK